MKRSIRLLGLCAVSLLCAAPLRAQGTGTTYEARAFTTGLWRLVPVGGPTLCIRFEPVGQSYSNEQVDLTSLTLTSLGTGSVTTIPCVPPKMAIEGDQDANGIAELPAWFSRTDLELLFDRIKGRVMVTALLGGRLTDGSTIQANVTLTLIMTKRIRGIVTPNPLHSRGVLRVTTSRTGPIRMRMYDVQGRLVRTLADRSVAAGSHDLPVDGVDRAGRPLGSGIYYVIAETGDGVFEGRFAVLK